MEEQLEQIRRMNKKRWVWKNPPSPAPVPLQSRFHASDRCWKTPSCHQSEHERHRLIYGGHTQSIQSAVWFSCSEICWAAENSSLLSLDTRSEQDCAGVLIWVHLVLELARCRLLSLLYFLTFLNSQDHMGLVWKPKSKSEERNVCEFIKTPMTERLI